MKSKLLYALVSLLFLWQPFAYAQEARGTPTETYTDQLTSQPKPLPQGCGTEGFTFQNGQLILGFGNSFISQLYLIHNNSEYEQLLLSHPTNTAMSAGWDSRIDQGQWSALTINRPNFVINCFGRRPGAIGYVDCKSVLQVCSYTNADIGANGSYWPSENKSLFDTLDSLRARNITVSK